MARSERGWREVPGFVHSVETGGMVDGPGVRYVVFTSGCPLQCLYCHNPDCQSLRSGRETTAGAVIDELRPYAPFLRRTGGLTVSGGEPLMQPLFSAAVLRGAKELGLHTVLDTSGYRGANAPHDLLDATDLVLLDVKSWDRALYRELTGVELEPTLDFARLLAERSLPAWIRFVLVPGLTDAPANVAGVARFVASLPNVQRVEVLPFHQMGRYKWEALGMEYRLHDTPPATAEQAERAAALFRSYGVRAA